jgi:hypothetical protein
MSDITSVFNGSSSSGAAPVEFSFGIIGDTQYFDGEDGQQWGDNSRVRRYRASLRKFEDAVQCFRERSTNPSFPPLPICVLLGDTIDGKCKQNNTSDSAYEAVLKVLERSNVAGPAWHFVIGNHDLYNFSRLQLYDMQQFVPVSQRSECTPEQMYYSTSPHPSYLFIFLDPFEISTPGGISAQAVEAAQRTLDQKNPNIQIKGANWLAGLSEADQRYVPYNGACSAAQLAWLSLTLQRSVADGQKVFVFCHCPLYAPCCRPSGLCWNSEEVLSVLHSTGNVVSCVYGHDHDGGYACDAEGVHHILPPAVLEAHEHDNAHGIISCNGNERYFEMEWIGQPPDAARHEWPRRMMFPSSVA